MNNVVYNYIGRVYFKKDNIGAGFNYIKEFEDSYDTIIITTDIEINFVERGWIGDITYWAANGFDIKDYKNRDLLTSEPRYVRDVLCIRVDVRSEQGSPVEWKYTFLKY